MIEIRTNSLLERVYPEVAAGIQFLFRVNALLEPGMTVLDLGAGRGANADEDTASARLYTLRGKVKHVIGLDVDDAVLGDPILDRAIVYDGGRMPLDDQSIDLIVSDYTFEHIQDAALLASEIKRVLRPGGWVCARTPHCFSLLYVASRLIPNARHAGALRRIQPTRKAHDVFPTHYLLNSLGALRRHFPSSDWDNASYTYSPEPGYHFGNRLVFEMLRVYQYLKQPFLGGEVLMVFLRKKPN